MQIGTCMGELKIDRIVLGMCSTNTYYIYREGSGECIVVDPADNGREIFETLLQKGLRTAGILLTHGHFDHIWGVEDLKAAANEMAEKQQKAPVLVYADEAEKPLLLDSGLNVSEGAGRACTVDADVYKKDGEEISILDITCRLISTPGHTAGGCCYYFEEAGFCVCGDTIFQESVGRTDFPTGSMSTLVRSIREKLFVLPAATKLYPGHGDSTTIEHEKKYNPYCG